METTESFFPQNRSLFPDRKSIRTFKRPIYTVSSANFDAPTGRGVIAYVVDTGYTKHPKDDNVVQNLAVVQRDEQGNIWGDDTDERHGTVVASIIAQAMPDITIAPLRHNVSMAGKAGQASKPVLKDCTQCFEEIAAHYREQCSGNDLDPLAIVNCSWFINDKAVKGINSEEDIKELHDAYIKLLELGIIVVVAAGNFGYNLNDDWNAWEVSKDKFEGSSGILTMLEDNIVVGAFDRSFRKTEFSSYGPNVGYWALGHAVQNPLKDPKYPELSGTSFATPFVSGIIAGLLSSPDWAARLRGAHGRDRQRAVRTVLAMGNVSSKTTLKDNTSKSKPTYSAQVFETAIIVLKSPEPQPTA